MGERSASERSGVRGVAEWMSRSVESVRAELRFVDCDSLDVLLYCQDDVVVSTREPEVALPTE
jgi:hypothetical protein